MAVRTNAKKSFIQLSTKGTREGTIRLKRFASEFTAGRLECQGRSEYMLNQTGQISGSHEIFAFKSQLQIIENEHLELRWPIYRPLQCDLENL